MGTFCTSPAIRNYKNNFFSELMGTFILVFGVLYMVKPNIIIEGTSIENFGIGSLEALPVGLLVWVIGLSLGGTTGYAINPARDLGPRITYQLIPRKNKISDWAYSWVPVLGPLCGGILAGLLFVYLQ
jgi:glycerol uptake facilitator protein